ncbi:hypothetical protein GR160_16020 [Flavobacterium sp. Sd200]|uniref:transposase n=1 Tax=Flavobacterium sp. Sd200 TaxID=2692211 RepID=UPI00136ABB68|nr:transposase [Flavobacterium sp. Sd200]MXN92736.1 hypothetical protein [Flavobacterium sp. Sd200]
MKLEPLIKDCMYHIYNRGINGGNIFITDENKMYFLNLVNKHLTNSSSLFAYCLMNNHFHFLLRIDSDGEKVTQDLSNLFNAYAKAFNKANNRTGSLFEKHFKRIRIDDENYLRQLIVYIHLNPYHHFDANFATFKYSSYNSILSNKETKLKRGEVIELFGDLDNYIFEHKTKKEILEQKFTLE